MPRLTAVILVLVAVLGACGGDDDAADSMPAGGGDLDGREFVGTVVAGRDLVANTEIRVRFADGTVSVNAGCNTLSGNYTVDGSKLVVDQLGGTEMGCDPALHEQDEWLAGFLADRPSFLLENGSLILTAGPVSMTLTDREVAEPDRPLVGTAWTVDTLYEGTGESATAATVPGDAEATFEIDDAGYRGDTGCNTYSGTASVGSGVITFEGPTITDNRCDGAAGALEAHVLAVLEGEVTYTVEGDVLTLMNEAQGKGLGLRAAPAE